MNIKGPLYLDFFSRIHHSHSQVFYLRAIIPQPRTKKVLRALLIQTWPAAPRPWRLPGRSLSCKGITLWLVRLIDWDVHSYDGLKHGWKTSEIKEYFSKNIGKCTGGHACRKEGVPVGGIALLTFADKEDATKAEDHVKDNKKIDGMTVTVYNFYRHGQVYKHCSIEKEGFFLVVDEMVRTERKISMGKAVKA